MLRNPQKPLGNLSHRYSFEHCSRFTVIILTGKCGGAADRVGAAAVVELQRTVAQMQRTAFTQSVFLCFCSSWLPKTNGHTVIHIHTHTNKITR